MKILGITGALPQEKVVHGEDKKKFVRLTGVHTRFISSDSETFYTLGLRAAQSLLEKLKINPEDIGFCISNSQTNDRFYPNIAFKFAENLKLHRESMAFDMHLGCSALPNVLKVASGLFANSSQQKPYGIIIIGDTLSKQSLKTDESTYPLFGDAVTAVVITKSTEHYEYGNFWIDEENPSIYVNGLGYDDNGSLNVNREVAKLNNTVMKGDKVFEFVSNEVFKFLDSKNLKNNFDLFAFHQGNKFMNDLLINKLGFNKSQSLESIHLFGNTSCASICMSIIGSQNKIQLERSNRLLLSGFGIGLNASYSLITLDKNACLQIV